MAEQVGRRPFFREVSRTRWYLRHPRYMRYMAREVTCIFIAVYTVILIVGIARLGQSPDAYQSFLQALQTPVSIAFHLAALVFSVYHSVTWFNLAPKAMPVRIGENTLPHAAVAGAHYVAWVLITLLVLWLAGAF
jgi:fumarate reductase subunit C